LGDVFRISQLAARYYFPLGELEVGRARNRGELPHHRDERGQRRVRVLDVIAYLEVSRRSAAALP